MSKWEYMELRITHDEVEVVDDELQSSNDRQNDPFDYVRRMVEDGWEIVTKSGALDGEFSVVLKRPLVD